MDSSRAKRSTWTVRLWSEMAELAHSRGLKLAWEKSDNQAGFLTRCYFVSNDCDCFEPDLVCRTCKKGFSYAKMNFL